MAAMLNKFATKSANWIHWSSHSDFAQSGAFDEVVHQVLISWVNQLKNKSIFLILTLSVFTGTVSANTDLVTDKAITMQFIKESFEQDSLVIDKADFENDVKALLAEKPYMPKQRFFARITDTLPAVKAESEE